METGWRGSTLAVCCRSMSRIQPVYVFASHKHRDHFDMDVLHLAEKYPKIRFIFSKDCKMSPHFLVKHGFAPEVAKRIHYVGAVEKCRVDDLNIETLRSTDAGVAFYVETNGRGILPCRRSE